MKLNLNKPLAIAIVLAVVAAAVLLYFLSGGFDRKSSLEEENFIIGFAPQLEAVIQVKIKLLGSAIKNPAIISEIRKVNQKNQTLTLNEIIVLDKNWIYSEENQSLAALELVEFQKEHPEFYEIFVTDKLGLNAAQTNETSDFYQADEDWWIGAYNGGEGREYHGILEFDESAQTEGISIYIPVHDPDTNEVIGISKAVLSVDAIKSEL